MNFISFVWIKAGIKQLNAATEVQAAINWSWICLNDAANETSELMLAWWMQLVGYSIHQTQSGFKFDSFHFC